MDPIPEFRLRFEQVEDGKVLIILDIFKGEETPYYYSGDGALEAYDRMKIYSPGGMPDGSIIQDRDPLTVPSTRRNPVLADIFNRLGYMERKGSGFGKIIGGYEFQINYDESKKPSFRSDRYQFTVVMPNLNYNVPQDVPQDVPRNVPQKKESNPLEIQILNMIKKDNKISTEKMAMTLGISSKTVKRHIKDIGIIRFVGRGSNGHWEIIDD